MNAHTPGPWGIEDPMSFELAVVEAGKSPADWGFVACLPFKDEDDPSDNDFPRGVVHANAHLISAAPEMYQFCREVLDWVYGTRVGRCMTDDMAQRLSVTVAKAEGRS